MNKTTTIILAAIALLALAGGVFLYTQRPQKAIAPIVAPESQQAQAITITLTIEGSQPQTFDLAPGSTALEATQKGAQVTTSGEGEMAFVTAINGKTADSAKHEFWELVVNGTPAQVGAGSYKVQAGDKLEWKISTY